MLRTNLPAAVLLMLVAVVAVLALDYTNEAVAVENSIGFAIGSEALKPVCSVTTRGKMYVSTGTLGMADTFSLCAKNVQNNYVWTQILFQGGPPN